MLRDIISMYKNTLEVFGYENLPKFDSPRLRSLRMDRMLIDLLTECRALKIIVRSTLRNANTQNLKSITKNIFFHSYVRLFVRRFQQVRSSYWPTSDPSYVILSYVRMLFYSNAIGAQKSANQMGGIISGYVELRNLMKKLKQKSRPYSTDAGPCTAIDFINK